MKQTLTLRALFVLFLSAIVITSCEKADLSDEQEQFSNKKHKFKYCTTEFTGESISCSSSRQVIYRFTSENDEDYIKMQGDLVNFTGPDAVVTVTGASLNVSQWTAANSSNRTVKLDGSVSACEQVTITITWNSNYPGGVVTGEWSVKNDAGIDLATPVAIMQCGEERAGK